MEIRQQCCCRPKCVPKCWSQSADFGQVGFESGRVPAALKPAVYLGFCVPYQNGQVRRSGENWPPESDFRPSPRWASQQVCPENRRKPVTQRGGRPGGERGSHVNWRRKCDRIRTVSAQRPTVALAKGISQVVWFRIDQQLDHGLPCTTVNLSGHRWCSLRMLNPPPKITQIRQSLSQLSDRMSLARITWPHFSISALRNCPHSSDVLATISQPCASIRVFTAGSLST